jgi:ribonucleoside-diphosphate reductase alpha chain
MTGPVEDWPAISRLVWETKYRWADEANISDTWRRVARAVASVETADRELWAGRFRELLDGFRFLPGGRIIAGAGTDRHVTLFNCFVMGEIEDTLEGIFDGLKQGAMTMQRGGGVGYDFSTLRPQGTPALTSGSIASGPVSFMRIWDAMCATMLSTGARRGAMMATLRCDHPDIEAFVDAKRHPEALRHFNVSVQVTDAFMAAVVADADWPLVFPEHPGGSDGAGAIVRRRWTGSHREVDCTVVRVIRAKALWERILKAAYDTAEPGVLFIDRINEENNLHDQEQLTATNPCGEIPLPPYGACNLGSLNLTTFVREPFEPGASLDLARLVSAAGLAVRFLDNIIDLSEFPLPQQAKSARATRRIGLGITGLADALAMLGHRYDGWTARGLAEDIIKSICIAAYEASVQLAREREPFPSFDRSAFLASRFVARLPAELRETIASHGMRNSHLLAIAPAGTISVLAGNVSSGIEPIFALEAQRRILEANGHYRIHEVRDFAWRLWRTQHPGEPAPEALVTAQTIGAGAHLEMQAILQPWVDNAISKTINVPANMRFGEFCGLFELAFRRGLKGCTVFRPNPVRGQILSAGTPQEPSHCCDLEREAD